MQRPNFNRNFQTFILSNDLSNQDAADMINEELARLDAKNERIYMSNDVWTIAGRGSTPRNHLVMVAIANIIGKSLEELIVNLYDTSDLYRPDLKQSKLKDMPPKNASMCCEKVKTDKKYDIAALFEKMSSADQDFALELSYSMELENDSVFLYSLLDVDMPLDGLIDIRMYLHDGSSETSNLLSDWASFAIQLKDCDYDPCAVLANLVKDPLLYPFTEGLHVNVTPFSVTRYQEGDIADGEQLQNAYMVKMKVDLDRDSVLFLYERSLERAKKHLAELEAQQKQCEKKNDKNNPNKK